MKLFIFGVVLLVVTSAWGQQPAAIEAYQSGLNYYHLRNYKQALAFFDIAIQKDPNFVNAHRSLISCHEQLGNTQDAIQAYMKVVQVAPSDKKLYYNLALTYVEIKQYDQAVAYLNKALKIDPLYDKANNRLKEIKAYLDQSERQIVKEESIPVDYSKEKQQYQKALDAYREEDYKACLVALKAYKEDVTFADFYYLEAIARQQLGERLVAQKLYKKALKIDAKHFNSNLNLGRMFYNEKDYAAAVKCFEKAHSKKSNNKKLLYDLARAYYYNQQYNDASEKLEQYVRGDMIDGKAWRLLGSSYSQLGKSKDAASAFEKAKRYGVGDDEMNKDIASKGNKARALTNVGKYKEAIGVLEKAIEEHPREAALYFNLGLNYMNIGNFKKAKLQFVRTVELDPTHAKAYEALGMLHYDQEEFQKAGAYYLSSINAGKQDEYLYYKMGNCWFKLKQFEKAVDAYTKAIEFNNQEKNFFFSLGAAQLALNEQYKAIKSMKKVLELDPQHLEAQYSIVVAYFKMSDYKPCMAEAEKILEKNPRYAKAYLMIGHCYHRMGKYGLAKEYQDKAKRLDPSLKY